MRFWEHSLPLAPTAVPLAPFLRRSSGNFAFQGSVATAGKKQLHEYCRWFFGNNKKPSWEEIEEAESCKDVWGAVGFWCFNHQNLHQQHQDFPSMEQGKRKLQGSFLIRMFFGCPWQWMSEYFHCKSAIIFKKKIKSQTKCLTHLFGNCLLELLLASLWEKRNAEFPHEWNAQFPTWALFFSALPQSETSNPS